MKPKIYLHFIFSITSLVVLLSSCGFSFNGKILKRGECDRSVNIAPWVAAENSHKQFLVNTSSSEIITFTVKLTHTLRADRYSNKVYETSTNVNTSIYTLNPGEEKELECEKYIHSKDKEIWDEYNYEIVGAVKAK